MKEEKLIEKLDNRKKFKHEQHTKDFNKEVNSPNQNVQQPFRIMDETWIIGKNKGQKLKDTPKHYIKWVLENFNNMSSSHRSILNKYL